MTKEQKKKASLVSIVLAVLVVGVLAYAALYFGVIKGPQPAKAIVPSADAAAAQFSNRQDLTDPKLLDQIAEKGMPRALELGGFKETTTGPVLVSEIKSGSWTQTVTTKMGPVPVKVTSSLKGTKTWLELSPNGITVQLVIQTNTTPLKVAASVVWRDKNGNQVARKDSVFEIENSKNLGPVGAIGVFSETEDGRASADVRLEPAN